MSFWSDYEKEIGFIVSYALYEDLRDGDVTTDPIYNGEKGKAKIIAKEEGIICGLPIANMVYNFLSENIDIKFFKNDGDHVEKGDLLLEIKGDYDVLLKGERVTLNFIQHLSGISTYVYNISQLLKGTSIKILDTRKTMPGLRRLQKYAVKIGGGENHRFNLGDMALIKENHIDLVGSIKRSVDLIHEKYSDIKIEVEVKNLEEFKEAISISYVNRIMLDNMDRKDIEECLANKTRDVEIEVSGGMTPDKIEKIKDLDIDYISMGGITHSVKSLDISMYIERI